MKYGIARATNDHQLQQQVRWLEDYGCDEIRQFVGLCDDTRQVQETIEKMIEGDELIACHPDRLFRDPAVIEIALAKIYIKKADVTFLSAEMAKAHAEKPALI